MSKRIRKSGWSVEFDLPEPVIQLVQSFLASKEAARTSILSKSWRSAWLTRPDLDFDEKYFRGRISYFLSFAEKTLERYENSNLNIDSFRLRMKQPNLRGIATNLVLRALKLGPTRLTFKFDVLNQDFDIPDEVFRHENLVSLTAEWCRINLNPDGVCCSRLQFLSLKYVKTECPDTIFRILIKRCPLIEKLSLSYLYYDVGDSCLDLLQTNINLLRLKSLVLENVNFDTRLLADLSFRFPSLKDLTLSIISKDREDQMLISSTTLERLDMSGKTHRVKLDIPSIRKLTFSCSSIPKLSIRSNSRGWKSHVSVSRRKCLSVSWFYKLSKLLNKLRLSRISLSLHVYSRTTFDYYPGNVRGLPTPEIENLKIYHEHLPTQSCYVLFDGLFGVCRPKVITQYKSDGGSAYGLRETNNVYFLGKIILDSRDANAPIANYQYMYGLNDLKEARAQVFVPAVSRWRDVTLDSLLEKYSTVNAQGYYTLHRLQLNWRAAV